LKTWCRNTLKAGIKKIPMRIKKSALLACSIAILLSGCNTFQKIPGRDEVKKTTGEFVRILERANNIGNNRSLFSISAGKNPGILPLIIRNASMGLVILIITLFAAAAVYFISERISLRVYGDIGEREREEKLEIESFDPDVPGKLAGDGRYSDAVLYIYRAALLDISRAGFPYSKGMTNFMVSIGINDPVYKSSFRGICSFADRVLFDSHDATEDEYGKCRNEFEAMRGVRL
jgi:hypothetical protein